MQMQKMYKKIAQNATYKGKRGVRDKKKGRSKWLKKFLRYLRRWLQASFQGIKCKKFCRGKTEKCKKCNIQGGMPSRKKRKKKKNLTAKNKMSQNANNNNDNNAFAYLALKNTTTEAPPTRIFFREGLRIEQRRITIKMELTKQTKG